ncbi:MAG: type II secretion system F family protein [Planctomycetales bacterium]|nr:type II secretion system F family protein [Planctomycetales bacterium]
MLQPVDITLFSAIAATVLLAPRLTRRHPPKTRPAAKALRRRVIVFREKPQPRASLTQQIDQGLVRMLHRAGLRLSSQAAILLTAGAATVIGATTVACGLPLWSAVLLMSSVFIVAIGGVYVAIQRRIRKFSQQFPTALELMARATRAGENLEAALQVAGSPGEQPLQSEFDQCVRQLRMGMSPADVAEFLAERIDTTDVHLFAHTLVMHGQVGGTLANSLERLSSVIRDRAEFDEKMRVTTGIARFAIFTIVSIGFLVFLYMQAVQPEYIGKLTQSDLGQQMIAYGLVSELVGLGWVALMLKSEL